MTPPTRSAGAGGDVTVTVRWNLRTDWRARGLLERCARHALAREQLRRGSLSIVVVGQKAMQRLHREHLGLDHPTDVLTFDLRDTADRHTVDGEVIVCADVARTTAARRQQKTLAAARRELALYVVHGILHLADHDDTTPLAAARMHRRENTLLAECGLGAVYGPVD